jgi:serine/threonine-protein kinase
MWTSRISVETDRGLAGEYRVADVFLGEDGRLGRDVAIKSVRFDKAADPDVRRRFACEGRAAARLSHNVVGVYDVGEGRTRPYLVTAR